MLVHMITCIVGNKGGTGKSTLSVHLAAWLHRQGRSVHVLDTDVQRASQQWLREACPDIPVTCMTDVDELLDQIPKIALGVDETVIDGPAASPEIVRALLLRSDKALLPTTPGLPDLRSLASMVRVVTQCQDIRGGAPDAALVLNRVMMHTRVGRGALEAVEALVLRVCRNVIRQRMCIVDAATQGVVVHDLGHVARDAVEDFNGVFEETYHGEEEEKPR